MLLNIFCSLVPPKLVSPACPLNWSHDILHDVECQICSRYDITESNCVDCCNNFVACSISMERYPTTSNLKGKRFKKLNTIKHNHMVVAVVCNHVVVVVVCNHVVVYHQHLRLRLHQRLHSRLRLRLHLLLRMRLRLCPRLRMPLLPRLRLHHFLRLRLR